VIRPAHRPVEAVQVIALPLAEGDDPVDRLAAFLATRQEWMNRLEAGRAEFSQDPFRLGPVVRVYEDAGAIRDLHSGRSTTGPLKADDLRRFLLDALPVPEELEPLLS
jgi:hypothetical protein